MYSLAVRLLGDPGVAEEVVQDTLVKLWQHLDRLEEEHVLPWLLRVTRNASLDQIRRSRHRQSYLTIGGGESIDGVDEANPEQHVENVELGGALDAAVRELKEPYRSLVLMRDVQGHSYRDVGESLELSDSQVKVYLHRARRMLRHKLRGEAKCLT